MKTFREILNESKKELFEQNNLEDLDEYQMYPEIVDTIISIMADLGYTYKIKNANKPGSLKELLFTKPGSLKDLEAFLPTSKDITNGFFMFVGDKQRAIEIEKKLVKAKINAKVTKSNGAVVIKIVEN